MNKITNNNGITVRQLKQLIKDWPEINTDTGEECEVWIHTEMCSSQCNTMGPLNVRVGDNGEKFGDIYLED